VACVRSTNQLGWRLLADPAGRGARGEGGINGGALIRAEPAFTPTDFACEN
jgi:hypothetical protein